jgi:hypothetical protein
MNSEQQKTKTNEKRRKRYAEDPEYRERVLAAKRGRKTQRLPSDPEFREKKRARDRAKNWKHRKVANAHVVDYDAMLGRQGGVCKICRKPALKRLCLDHDHANGWIRGLLCHKCNTGVGLFDDDIGRILRAAVYLVLCGALPALACALVAAMARFFRAVMAGLVTASRVYPTCGTQCRGTRASPSSDAIHVFKTVRDRQDVDARHKATSVRHVLCFHAAFSIGSQARLARRR